MTSYCDVAPTYEWHGPYPDREYGFPLETDAELTILKKREAFVLRRQPAWSR